MTEAAEGDARAPALTEKMTVLAWALFLLPFAVHLYVFVTYARNSPHADDYDTILRFLEEWTASPAVGDRWHVIWQQHNEHRLVVHRLLVLADWSVFGEVSFWRLGLYGNLAWLVAIGMLAWVLRRRYLLTAWELLPVPYLLLTLSHHENFPSAIQNYAMFLWVIPFLACLAASRSRPLHGLFPLALFTSGGGLFLAPLGLGEMLRQRRWKAALAFAASAGIVLLWYFAQYHRPEEHPPLSASLNDPRRMGVFFFTFIGNATLNVPVAATVGALTVVMLTVQVVRQWSERFLCLLAGFVGMTAVTVTLARSGLGLGGALSSRYALYHQLAWVALYAFTLRDAAGKRWRQVFVASVALAAMTFYVLTLRAELSPGGWLDLEAWGRTRGLIAFARGKPGLLDYPRAEFAEARLREAQRLGIYNYTLEVNQKAPQSLARTEVSFEPPDRPHLQIAKFGLDTDWAALTLIETETADVSLALDGGGDRLLALPFQPIRDPEALASIRHDRRLGKSIFRVYFPEYSLPAGEYRAGILLKSGPNRIVKWSNAVVRVAPEGRGSVEVRQSESINGAR